MCGNSDPGTSGCLSPYSKINGLYFNDSMEPQSFMYSFMQDIENIAKKEGKIYVKFDVDNEDACYSMINELSKYTTDNTQIFGTSRENHYEVIVDQVDDEDNTDKPEEPEVKQPKTKKTKK